MEDEKIIELFFKGLQEAIEETKKKYDSYCKSISINILNNKEDVEECVLDSYLKLWENIPPTRPNSLKAYLGKIVRNTSLNRAKQKNTKKYNSNLERTLTELDEILSDSKNIDDSLNEKILIDAINNFLKEESKENRVIFVKRYFYLKEIKEIAKEENKKENSVKSSLFRTRNKLKIYLEKEGINI